MDEIWLELAREADAQFQHLRAQLNRVELKLDRLSEVFNLPDLPDIVEVTCSVLSDVTDDEKSSPEPVIDDNTAPRTAATTEPNEDQIGIVPAPELPPPGFAPLPPYKVMKDAFSDLEDAQQVDGDLIVEVEELEAPKPTSLESHLDAHHTMTVTSRIEVANSLESAIKDSMSTLRKQDGVCRVIGLTWAADFWRRPLKNRRYTYFVNLAQNIDDFPGCKITQQAASTAKGIALFVLDELAEGAS